MGKREQHDQHVKWYWAITRPQHDAHVRARRRHVVGEKVEAEQARVEQAKANADDKRMTSHRMVQDPSITDAEYFHQRQTKSGPNVGKVAAHVNMVEFIGGLARLSGASEMQIMAAAKYRNTYERAQIGGARAVDYAAVKVDTSGPRGDVLLGRQVDDLEAYKDAVRFLGLMDSALVERVVCHDHPLTTRGMGARARAKAKEDLFSILDDLAEHFKLTTKKRAA